MPDSSSQIASKEVRRRVLIVTDTLANGGMERQLTILAKALPRTWQVRVAALTDGVYAPILRDAGIEVDVIARAFRYDVRPIFPLSRIIREWSPSVVHTYGWMSMLASLVPCRLSGIPIVDATIQDASVPRGRSRLTRAFTRRADVVISNSRAGLDANRVDSLRGMVVYNGFDPDRWDLCRVSTRADGPTTVVMTARMHPHKDYRCLLDAARILCESNPSGWRFLAVGSGEQRDGLMEDYGDLIARRVLEFPQAGTEVLGLVSGSSIGVLLTNAAFHAEGIPNSIMEYMACGLPVVCTDSGGNRELVVDGITGIVVPPGDVDAVVRGLRSLRADTALAARMGMAGRDRIATVFTVDALVAGTLEAYERAVQGR